MKKFLVVLLSLGFVMAFSVSAFAISADFTGQYYANGRYWDNPTLLSKDSPGAGASGAGLRPESYSEWDARLRLFTRFKVAEGISVTTRADMMETQWGQEVKTSPFIAGANGATVERNNSINVEQVYLSFSAPIIGSWNVGYKSARPFGWGTAFMNSTGTNPGVEWSYNIGPARVFFDYYKAVKGNLSGKNNSSWQTPNYLTSDSDTDMYDLGMFYRAKAIDTGIMVTYIRDATLRSAAPGTVTGVAAIQPYFKGTFGPVNLEAEGYWFTGKDKSESTGAVAAVPDVDIDAKGIYVGAKFNIGPAYVGGLFLYNSGDDPGTKDKLEGTVNSKLQGYNRDKGNGFWGDFSTLIKGYHYHDTILKQGMAGTDSGSTIDNIWLYQINAGMDITKKLSFQTRFHIAKADQDGAAGTWQSKDYGREADLLVTFKIYDQLTYNLGAAYLWTGDWFKGTSATAQVTNAYYLLHYIDLNF